MTHVWLSYLVNLLCVWQYKYYSCDQWSIIINFFTNQWFKYELIFKHGILENFILEDSNDDNSKCTLAMINKKIFVFTVSCIIPDLTTDHGTNEKLNFQKFILYHLHNNPWHIHCNLKVYVKNYFPVFLVIFFEHGN